ncbi:hypothetical protein K488DRAFT_82005 [Vararia minispora EC-137]|uniref:Uncharacterized protein n=1 Tax=Vararia minispora EC-137 TaxID=1314806 RepID=A0ACB8QXC5_9AGAM|nr:hypothetical protein K488DRAFT_82005 [Vararia minispora EC-137]
MLRQFCINNCTVFGYCLEGLSVWENVTKPGHDWGAFINNLTVNAIRSQQWTNDAGVITEGSQGFRDPNVDYIVGGKGIFIGALHEAWRRTDPSSPMANLVSAFINVQFNALTSMAALGNGNYSYAWDGSSPRATFEAWGQTAVVRVFSAALDLEQRGATSANVTTPATLSAHSSNVGVIVGGTVGAAAGVSTAVGLAAYFLRRRQYLRRPSNIPETQLIDGQLGAFCVSWEKHRLYMNLDESVDSDDNQCYASPIVIVTNLSSEDGSSLSSSARAGIIAGSAVGGIALLILLFGLFFMYRRRLDKKRYSFLKREPPPRAAFLADEVDDSYRDDPLADEHGRSYELPPRLLRARASESGSIFTEAVWPPPQNALQDPISTSGDLGDIVGQVMGPPRTITTPLPPSRGGTGTPRLRGGSGDSSSLYSADDDSLLAPVTHERPGSIASQLPLLSDSSRQLVLTNPDAPGDDTSTIASPQATPPASPRKWLDRSPRPLTLSPQGHGR